MIKNKYILPEEFSRLINNIPEKYNNMKSAFILIYEQNYKSNEALKECGVIKTFRTVERIIKRYSNNLICMADLRRSYLYSHPNILFEKNKQKRRKLITPRIRWKVLCRDNFRCVACGKSSQETILHIDHIIPISRNGKTELSNLRTLCGECNMGRGNLMLDISIKY